jgi:uncharacterized protein (TIGR02453 family)
MKTVLNFLKQLKRNNRREWFEKHRDVFDTARLEFENLVFDLTESIARFDPAVGQPEPRDCIFRIYRDVRFSKDKSPYKTHFGAVLGPKGRKTQGPLYYIHVSPGDNFFGGGVYQPPPDQLDALRHHALTHAESFLRIIRKPVFRKFYGDLWDDKLQRPPKGFPADDPNIDLAKYKSYVVMHALNEREVLSPRFRKTVVNGFRLMKDFNDFLRQA